MISKPIQKQEIPKHVSSKAARLLEQAQAPKKTAGGDIFKKEFHVTDEMFEAAKLMKNGVAHVKDLDMSVLKSASKPDSKNYTYTAQVTLIDIFTGESTTTTAALSKSSLSFDFNSDQHFNADANSVEVARMAWDWLLNPVGFDRFRREIKDKKIMIIQNRSGFTYKQSDAENDLLSLQSFRDFVQTATEHAKETGDDSAMLKYGHDVDVVKFINGKRHTINPSCGVVEHDLLFDFFDVQRCSLRLSRPHEFSSSIAKLLCLGDELFESDTGVNAYITPYPKASPEAAKADSETKGNKREQGFAPHYDDIDAFLIQLEGAKQWHLLKPEHDHQLLDIEPSKDYPADLILSGKLHKYWNGLLKEGDLLYMPRGVIHYGKTQALKTGAEGP